MRDGGATEIGQAPHTVSADRKPGPKRPTKFRFPKDLSVIDKVKPTTITHSEPTPLHTPSQDAAQLDTVRSDLKDAEAQTASQDAPKKAHLAPEYSDEVTKAREERRKSRRYERVFGEIEVDLVRSGEEALQDPDTKPEFAEKIRTRIPEYLALARNDLQKKHGGEGSKRFVEKFFYEGIAAPEVAAILAQTNQSELTPSTLFDSNIISDEMLSLMMQSHIDQFQAKETTFKLEVPRRLAEYKACMKEYCTKQNIPLPQEALEQLDPEQYHLIDELMIYEPEDPENLKRGGRYLPSRHQVFIATGAAENVPTFFHEASHVISGKKIVISPGEKQDNAMIATTLRDGFSISLHPKLDGEDRFTWLNEAVTQELTEGLMKEREGLFDEPLNPKDTEGVYWEERRVLAALIERSDGRLSLPDIVAEYLSTNNLPKTSTTSPVEPFEPLRRRVDEAYRPGFLAQLDKKIRDPNNKAGVSYALFEIFGAAQDRQEKIAA